MGGDRPVTQVLRWTTPEVYQDLGRRAHLVAAAPWTGARARAASRARGRRSSGAHVCFVSDGVAEVSAHVRYGHRSRAVAARFERRRDRWVCSALEFA